MIAQRPDHAPGEAAPVAGTYEQLNIFGRLRLLSKDCVKRASVSAYDLCGVHCPELLRVLPGQDGNS